jgi:apolipoprotein D and lipocalin family protein
MLGITPWLRRDVATCLRLAAGFSALWLLACVPTAPQASYRSPSVPIYSTANLPIAQVLGTWAQVAGLGKAEACPKWPYLQIFADNGTSQPAARYDLCLGGARFRGAGAMASAGAAGRYNVPGLPAPIWVLWLSGDASAMAIGTPDGRFAAILSKTAISPDKLQAAQQILAWNGYDLAQFYQY